MKYILLIALLVLISGCAKEQQIIFGDETPEAVFTFIEQPVLPYRVIFYMPENSSMNCTSIKEEPFNNSLEIGIMSLACFVREMEYLYPQDTQRLLKEYNISVQGGWII